MLRLDHNLMLLNYINYEPYHSLDVSFKGKLFVGISGDAVVFFDESMKKICQECNDLIANCDSIIGHSLKPDFCVYNSHEKENVLIIQRQ